MRSMGCAKKPSVSPRRRTARTKAFRRLAAFTGLLGVALAACRDTLPQSSLNPAGPQARTIENLFIPVFWIAVGVFVVVEGAIVFAAIRYRQRKGQDANPVQVHGNTKLEIIWTVIPAVILAVISVPTIGTIFELAKTPTGSDVVNVRVVAHQWWWEFEYPDLGVVTSNELHMPLNRPVHLEMESQEVAESGSDINAIPVIHSLWVPRLGGKQDIVPGRVNTMTLEADIPGIYQGQCAEFCGLSHASMRFRVIAESDAEFDAWVEAQKAPPAEPAAGTLEAEGSELFNNGSCIGCHINVGTLDAKGAKIGPNLADFGARHTLGAGIYDNTPENLARWLDDPRRMKPGVVMPDYDLTEDQIEALVAYLRSLK